MAHLHGLRVALTTFVLSIKKPHGVVLKICEEYAVEVIVPSNIHKV